MRNRKIKQWTRKQLKKTRWKKSFERAKKHGLVYGGWIAFDDFIGDWMDFEVCFGGKIPDKKWLYPRNE